MASPNQILTVMNIKTQPMKYLLLTLALTTTTLASCQMNSNIISQSDFNAIKINNQTLNAIKATDGDQGQVQNLFSAPIIESNIDEDYVDFTFNGFDIGFSDGEISGFHILNNNWSITIQGVTISVNDDISVLGNVVINSGANGARSVIYQHCNGCNNYLSIDIDPNNKIRKIVYIEMT